LLSKAQENGQKLALLFSKVVRKTESAKQKFSVSNENGFDNFSFTFPLFPFHLKKKSAPLSNSNLRY